jgi:hypothetical protein
LYQGEGWRGGKCREGRASRSRKVTSVAKAREMPVSDGWVSYTSYTRAVYVSSL